MNKMQCDRLGRVQRVRALAQVCRRNAAGVCATTCGDPAARTAIAAGSGDTLDRAQIKGREEKGGSWVRWVARAVTVCDRLLLRNKPAAPPLLPAQTGQL